LVGPIDEAIINKFPLATTSRKLWSSLKEHYQSANPNEKAGLMFEASQMIYKGSLGEYIREAESVHI
jgi:hypothetical protein